MPSDIKLLVTFFVLHIPEYVVDGVGSGGEVMRGEVESKVVHDPCSPHAYTVCVPWILFLGDEARDRSQREIRPDEKKIPH